MKRRETRYPGQDMLAAATALCLQLAAFVLLAAGEPAVLIDPFPSVDVKPTFVHGLKYAYYYSLRPDEPPTWVEAIFTCKNPAHTVVLNNHLQYYDPELAHDVWSPGDGIAEADKQRYFITRRMAIGAEGTVYEAVDIATDKLVIIKKVTNLFTGRHAAHTSFKVWAEVKMLKLAKASPDIMNLNRMIMGFNTAYIVVDLLEVEVPAGQHPASGDILTEDAAGVLQRRVFQYIRGVAFFHSANLVHGDLRWHNVMLDEACNVVIIDLGNTNAARSAPDAAVMSQLPMEHDASEFRREMWMAGTTLLSWIAGEEVYHLTKHNTTLGKAETIVSIFGFPLPEALAMYTEEVQRVFEAARPYAAGTRKFTDRFPTVDVRFFDLINEMMRLDRQVETAAELLDHPYLRELHAEEPLAEGPGDVAGLFEATRHVMRHSLDEARHLLMAESHGS